MGGTMRIWRQGRDEGFTLVEVLIAVTIFFIVFSAVMTLMLSIINTNIQAREKTTLTNAANTYIERVRAMNYNTIGTTSNPPFGSLAPTSTVISGYTITMTPAITWVDDPTIVGTQNYKKLRVAVTATREGGTVMRYSAETIIKKPDTGSNPNAQPPDIDFTAGSPADRASVEGSNVNIGATAHANGANVTLTSVNFYCDGVAMQNSFGNTAQWPINAASYTQTFSWDTEANNEDGVALSGDGWHLAKVECWDSNGKQDFAQRLVLVDNEDPFAPAALAVTNVANANQLQITWPPATDGNTTADHYLLETWKQGASATGTTSKTGWASSSASHANTTVLFAPAAFSRYAFVVRASNPSGSRLSPPVEALGMSRPVLSGTWRNNLLVDNKKDSQDVYSSTHTLSLSTPAFPYSSIVSTLYRSTSSAMTSPVLVSSGNGFSYTYTTASSTGGATQYYHQVKTVITPSGYNGLDSNGNPVPNVPITIWSNVIGPNAATGAVSGTQAHVRW